MSAKTEPRALADAGQQLSLGILTSTDYENFDRIIRSYAVGQRVSINLVRGQLDAVGIPEVSRGGLFNRAVKAGLIEQAVVVYLDQEYPVMEPSTGPSAKNARVKVYVRTDPAKRGA